LNFYLEEDVYLGVETKAWERIYGRREEFYLIHIAESKGENSDWSLATQELRS